MLLFIYDLNTKAISIEEAELTKTMRKFKINMDELDTDEFSLLVDYGIYVAAIKFTDDDTWQDIIDSHTNIMLSRTIKEFELSGYIIKTDEIAYGTGRNYHMKIDVERVQYGVVCK